MKRFLRQQTPGARHHKRLMYHPQKFLLIFISLLTVALMTGCGGIIRKSVDSPTLLKYENAERASLISEVDRFAKLNSMRAKMDLKFEDNSSADVGIAEKLPTADGEVVVQRPSNISLKVQAPVVKVDIVQMTSNGDKFRVAVLNDGGGGEYKKFLVGSNNADYSVLEREVERLDGGNAKALKKNVNAFKNVRPQHFTEALLVRPTSTDNIYVQSEIFQEEFDLSAQKKSPLRWVLRGYYLLDEIHKGADGTMKVARRFWFDRVGKVRLARQQIFDERGNIDSDIVYGAEGNLATGGEYDNLPLRIEVTRPKEKYKMSLTYQDPAGVSVGKTYPQEAFELENRWNLPEVDLDKRIANPTNAAAPQTGNGAAAAPRKQ